MNHKSKNEKSVDDYFEPLEIVVMRALFLTFSIFYASLVGTRSEIPTLDGAWVLSEKWTGFMGIALVIKSNEFRFWAYSDYQPEKQPRYPIIGKVESDGDKPRRSHRIARVSN